MVITMAMLLVASISFGFLAYQDIRDERYREIIWDALGILIAFGIILVWDLIFTQTITWVSIHG